MNKDYCCDGFEMLVSNKGQAGLSALLKKGEKQTYFCLQSRACAFEDIKTVSGTPCFGGGKIRISEQMGLRYCPSCGKNLKEWIGRHSVLVKELVSQSEEFVL